MAKFVKVHEKIRDREMEKEFGEEMRKVYFGNKPVCKVENCLGVQFRASGYCFMHHEEMLEARKKKWGENTKDPHSPEVLRGQALSAYFQSNRRCERCGLFTLVWGEGKALYKKGYPKKGKSLNQGIWVLCNDCLKKEK